MAFILVSCQKSPQAKVDRFLKKGQELLAQKDYPRALLEFRNAASTMPKSAEPRYQMGLAYLASGDGASAVRSFRQATELDPNHKGAQLKLAQFMTASRDEVNVREAITRLQSVFGTSPDTLEAVNTLAIAEWRVGKPQDAAKRLEEALNKFPNHLQGSVTLARMKLSADDKNGAEAVLRKAVADAPTSALAELALGELYVSMKEPAKAEAEFRKAVQLDPKNAAALQDLGALQIAAKRLNEAEQTFKQLSSLPDKAIKPIYGLFLYNFGRRDEALKQFEILAKADPADRAARSRLVAAYFRMGRSAEAEQLLAAALKRNPKDTDALLQRAEIRVQAARLVEAEKDIKDVLHFAPDSANAHFVLAKIYLAKGMVNSQQDELRQVLRNNSASLPARLILSVSYLSSNQAKSALDTLNEAPEGQKNQMSWLLTHNWALLATGDIPQAKIGVSQALANGQPLEAVYQSATLHFLERDYNGARTSIDEALAKNPADVRIAQLMMDIYSAQKESTKGIVRLQHLAAAHPEAAPIQHLLGEWHLRTGNAAEARKAFEGAKAADSHFTAAEISLTQMDLEEGHNDAARQRLKGLLARQPANVPALLLAARADQAVGDRSSAIGQYRAVLAVDSTNAVALNNLAYILVDEKPDEALKFAQMAVERNPGVSFIQDTLGWVYYRRGLYKMAVPYLETAATKDATARHQFHLGMCYLKSGDQSKGQKLVREALAKDPNLAKTEQGW